MKIFNTVLISAIVFMSSHSFAQRGNKSLSGNCVTANNVVFDVFYGYPYFNGALLKSASNNSSSVRNLNHLGGKVEYMVSEKIGVGIEFTYADASVKFPSDSTKIWYSAGIRKYRILGKMNYHFATTETIDPYFNVGAGIKNTTVYNNEPGGGSLG